MKATLAVAALVSFFGECSEHGVRFPIDGHWVAGRDGHTEQPSTPDAGEDDDDAEVAQQTDCVGPPGLYADADCCQLAEGVEPYRPNYELWADDASKERHIYLPAGTQIDTSNPDRWNFPVGTRFYKTFSLNGLKLETRRFEKVAPAASIDSWDMRAYAWSEDQRSVAEASRDGAPNVLGTDHDIPSQMQCSSCHNVKDADAINGFGAIQLNHGGDGWTLARLLHANKLSNVSGEKPDITLASASLPGDHTTQAGLGYLHGNCGNCHGGPTPRAGLSLWSQVGTTSLEETALYKTGVCGCLQRWTKRSAPDEKPYEYRVLPGDSVHSAIVARMSVRGAGEQMPGIGTEIVDQLGVAQVAALIDSLDAASCNICPELPVAP